MNAPRPTRRMKIQECARAASPRGRMAIMEDMFYPPPHPNEKKASFVRIQPLHGIEKKHAVIQGGISIGRFGQGDAQEIRAIARN